MERVLTTEERIRRAEEIYRNKGNIRETKTKEHSKLKNRIIKKVIIQILVCLSIYCIFYSFQNAENLFSKDMLSKAKQIMEYDVNFNELHINFMNWINANNIFTKESENQIENSMGNELANELSLNETIDNNTNIGGATEEKIETNLSQMEIDANEIKNKYNITKPIVGTVTSRFGHRNPTTASVPKNHTGIDLAANTGTVIYASLDGIVKIASGEGDYGNHLRIEKDDVAIYYAHCNKLYVKEGEYVKQNQPIAEVGATGNVTGPHLHFEIRKNERYVNPDLILNF